jgi:hypothetical protein
VPEELRDHALFVAFAPPITPHRARRDCGARRSGSGAPIARQILDAYHATSPS